MLYQLVAEHWPGLRELAEQVGALPNFVIREFEEYLRCGILAHGFLELRARYKAPPATGDQEELAFAKDDGAGPPPKGGKRWAWLLGHVFQADVETCRKCGGPMRWAEVADEPEVIARIMSKHGLRVRTPPADSYPAGARNVTSRPRHNKSAPRTPSTNQLWYAVWSSDPPG